LTARDFGAAVNTIDIVVSDLVIAPISGLHLFDDKGSPSRFMPFIMLSGAADRASMEQSRKHGVGGFIENRSQSITFIKFFSVLFTRLVNSSRHKTISGPSDGARARRSRRRGWSGANQTSLTLRLFTRMTRLKNLHRQVMSGCSSCPITSDKK
jgi:DNA-binding NtrC family response regulator